jgi:hypothetical protein
MKPLRISLLLALSIAASPAAISGDYWLASGVTGQPGNRVWAIVDTATIVDSSGVRSAWTYQFSTQNDTISSVRGMHQSFDCGAQESVLRTIIVYEPKSMAAMESIRIPDPSFKSDPPGSIGELIAKFVCAGTKTEVPGFNHIEATDLPGARKTVLYLATIAHLQAQQSK